jgi:ATP-dependent DNA helicase DinG
MPSEDTEIPEFFSPGGLLSSAFAAYEHRPEQAKMARAVASAMEGGRHLIVEAGTGVGKSLAYLLPAFLRARQTGVPVVISTYTINLQDQLVDKDIPLLEKAVGVNIKAAVGKGRANYLCLRRLSSLRRTQPSLFEEEYLSEELVRIQDWSFDTEDGSLSDLEFAPRPGLWDLLNSSRFTCMGKSCQFNERCFFRRARQRLRHAQIVVANHSLYFTDIGRPDSSQQLLPPHTHAIFDEAHTLEQVASGCLGVHVSRRELLHIVARLAGTRKRRGLLQRLGGTVLRRATRLRETISRFFDAVETWAQENLPENMRFMKPLPVEQPLSEELLRLSEALVTGKLETDDEDLKIELQGYGQQLADYARQIEIVKSLELEGHVYWVEKRSDELMLRSAPVRVSGILPQVLYSRLRSCILTGATLGVGKRDPFDFLRDRLGLESFEELQLGSPFDYVRQAAIYIEKDLPAPESEDYLPAITQAMRHYLKISRGRALVLFTNYEHLQEVASRLTDFIEELGARVLVHGAGLSRARLLKEFTEETSSVLFGTSSFWQGIDVPGEALSCVIITRLPFEVPTVPLAQARCEELEMRGQNPFRSYSLPQAVIRLKQGAGRLIRSKTDTGSIVLLDSRVVTRRYGRTFLESLPPCKILIREQGIGFRAES